MSLVQPLSTKRLLLREFKESDWESVHYYFSNPEAYQFMEFGGICQEDAKRYLDKLIGFQSQDPRIFIKLALVLKKEEKLIGECGLLMPNLRHREGEIIFRLNPQFWKNGYGTEAARVVIDFGFKKIGLHRIEALCDIRNVGSIKVLEKVGMKREGCLREHKFIREKWRDSFMYSVLEQEWN